MGYTTDFVGSVRLSRSLSVAEKTFLEKFARTRRMKRDVSKLELPPLNEAVGLDFGTDGEYFVGGGGFAGQERDNSIVDYNCPPSTQPSLWCQWIPNEMGNEIEWDGGEKFYNYVEWLDYIIFNFLKKWEITTNGEIEWQGEDPNDFGKIVVEDNEIAILVGRKIFEETT
jgi:hypothetical protein